MTKTYNDIDAVTRLLEEKERDLELAAKIGQSLLKKNQTLTEQNDYLEEQVAQITEEVAQLHHELNLKDELLQFYTNAAEESEEDPSSSPTGKKSMEDAASGACASGTLQRKLKELEEENLSLRSEASHLKSETETYEEKEQQLVNDCVNELRLSSLQISAIAEELARKTEDASRQQEEITHLLSQMVDLQKKAKSYAVENEELSQHLIAAKDAQRQLTAELQELEEKYSECIEMLHEAQEELKNLRNRNYPASTPRRYHPLGLYPMDSLAAEIEGTMRKEMSMEDPECEEQKSHRKRVFETVKTVNQTVRQRSLTPTSNIPGSNQSLSARTSPQSSGHTTPRSTIYNTDSNIMDNRTQSILMEVAENQDSAGQEKKPSGADELRLALRRLSLRRQNNLSERRYFEDERERRRGGHGGFSLGHDSPMTLSDSIMSLGNLQLWASRGPYLPDKLQIVKPLEGESRESGKSNKMGKKLDGERHKVKKVRHAGGAEGGRKKDLRHGHSLEGDRARVWGWVRKTAAGIERERGRRWARDRAESRKKKCSQERDERPLSLMLFNSFWSVMHHHKSGSFTSPHTYFKDTQPRGWL